MLSKDLNRHRRDGKKTPENKLSKNKVRTGSNVEPKRQRISSSINKKNPPKVRNQLTVKPNKSKAKIDNPLCLSKSKAHNRNRAISQLVPKQSEIRFTKSLQKNQPSYFFNTVPNKRIHNGLDAPKIRNSPFTSHNKCYSNLTLSKYSHQMKTDHLASFGKTSSSEFAKIKKRKHDYIKNNCKTSNFEMSLHGFQSQNLDCPMNQTETIPAKQFDHTAFSEAPIGVYKQLTFDVTDEQLQGLQLSNKVPKISQIRQNVNTLFKKLKSSSKSKLLVISSNYEKIVSSLFTAIKNSNLPNCEISTIKSQISDESQKQNKEAQKNLKEFCQKSTYFSSPYSNQHVSQDVLQSQESSEHWDSYMNLNSDEYRTINQKKKEKQRPKQKLVKKLNLHAINKPDIKQYQDEFMDMQQNFSESWKRQISQQTRY